MRRRRYLAVVGAVLAAGCAARSDSSTPTLTPVPVGPTPSLTPDDGNPSSDAVSTFETLEIGDRDDVDTPGHNRPHELQVWNTADTSREIALTIRARRNGSDVAETVLHDTYEVPSDAALKVVLREPASYTVGVSVPAADDPARIVVPQDAFDCNHHGYRVAVAQDGDVDVTEFATAAGCPEPTRTET